MYMGGDFGTDNINLLWNQMMSTTTSSTGTGGAGTGTGGAHGYSTGSGGTSMSVPPVPRQSRILMEPDFRLIQALQK